MSIKKELLKEHSMLSSKIRKLTRFLNSDEFEQLDDKEKDLLREQLGAMQLYANIVGRRLNLHNHTCLSCGLLMSQKFNYDDNVKDPEIYTCIVMDIDG